jgi:cobalamin biosynthesis protein CobD/CbiB
MGRATRASGDTRRSRFIGFGQVFMTVFVVILIVFVKVFLFIFLQVIIILIVLQIFVHVDFQLIDVNEVVLTLARDGLD